MIYKKPVLVYEKNNEQKTRKYLHCLTDAAAKIFGHICCKCNQFMLANASSCLIVTSTDLQKVKKREKESVNIQKYS